MVPIQQLAALKRSARDDFLAGRYGLVCEGADRLPGHKFHQIVEALDDLPSEMVRDGPIARILFGADLGAETYGETVETSVAIGLMACRGVGNRPHAIPGLTLFQATIVHEVGHTIAFAEEHRLQREFNRVFWPRGERDRRLGNSVTVYGLMHPSEDFAEAFLHYRHSGELMIRVASQRYAWMRDHVFGGREFGRKAREPGRA
jgi:hypothetical protein